MNVLTRLAQWGSSLVGIKETGPLTKSDFYDPADFHGSSSFFRSDDAAAPSDFYTGWGHTGISTIANHVAILEKVLENDKGEVIKNNPEMEMMTFEMIRDLVSFLEIHGRAYVWKNRLPGGKTTLSLEVLNPQAMTCVRYPDTSGRFGIMRYEYKHGAHKWRIDPENILVFTYFHPLQAFPYNTERGMSGLAASDHAINADKMSDIWNGKFFENGGNAGNVLTTDKDLTKETAQRILDNWDNIHKGIKNSHTTALLTHGIKQQEGKAQKDMDFSNMKTVARDVILGRLKMPKAVIGLADGVNVGNVVAFDRIFSRRTILPIAILIQEVFNKGLFKGVGKFRFLNVVPTDVDEILRLFAISLITKNQALIELGYDEVEGGDEYISEPMSVDTPSTTPSGTDGDNSVPKVFNLTIEKCLDFSSKILASYKENKGPELQSDEWMESEFIEFKKRNDNYEKKLVKKLNDVFAQQKRYILKKIDDKKDFAVDKKAAPSLDKAEWYDVYYLAIYDVLGDIMKAEGTKARAQIGLAGAFGVPQATVRDMIIQQVKDLQLAVDKVTNEKIAVAIADADTGFDASKAVAAVFEDLSTSRVKMIARSESVRAGTDATVAQWKDSGLVVSKIWYTVEDERTCEYCGSMHETKVGVDEVFFEKGDTLKVRDADGFEQELPLDYSDTSGPPLHPNCRCRLKAVLKKA